MAERNIVLFLMAVSLMASNSHAGSALPFLKEETDAYTYSMGGIPYALSDEHGSYFHNPASLGMAVNGTLSYSRWNGSIPDTSYNYTSVILPTPRRGVYSLHFLSFNAGEEELFDENGTSLGTVSLQSDRAIKAGYGRNIGDHLSAGGNLSFVQSGLAERYAAMAVGADLSILFRSLDGRYGAALGFEQLPLQKPKYDSSSDSLPTLFRTGSYYKRSLSKGNDLVAGIEILRPFAESWQMRLGMEYLYAKFISLSWGYRVGGPDEILTAGMGFKISQWRFDYGASPFGQESVSHRFSLTYFWGAKTPYDVAESYHERGMDKKAQILWTKIGPEDPQYTEAKEQMEFLDRGKKYLELARQLEIASSGNGIVVQERTPGRNESQGKFNADTDVDENIPRASLRNPNSLAVIIGIETYKKAPPAPYALRDAAIFKEYAVRILGVPDDKNNIHFLSGEVTLTDLMKALGRDGWLARRATERKNHDIYIYFAGHGGPGKNKSSCLIPYDCDLDYAEETAFPLEELYTLIGDLKANSITVFIDACFSGRTRTNQMLLTYARPVFVAVDNPALANGKATVFYASTGEQASYEYPEKRHGLFTYYLLKGLKGEADENHDGKLTAMELKNYLEVKVREEAVRLDKEQTPQAVGNLSRVLVRY